MACITTTEDRRDTPRAVWMEKVASAGQRYAPSNLPSHFGAAGAPDCIGVANVAETVPGSWRK